MNLPIEHHLLTKAEKLEDIQVVAAHPQALRQCHQWLGRNLPWAELKEVDSNGQGAKLAEQNPTWAAIASEQAAYFYDLEILVENIEDNLDNTTRFWVVGFQETKPSGHDKTAITFTLKKNRPGALFEVLEILKARNIDMSRIISRPSPEDKWNYRFYIDLVGHKEEDIIWEALHLIEKKTKDFRVLGAFPISPLDGQ